MTQATYLGLDLGTSGVKALLIDETQTTLAEGHGALTVQRPAPGHSEQNPHDWIAAATQAIQALAKQADLSGLRGIGLSGQMHGATLLDRADQVLRPCILWNDTRSAEQAAAMDADPQFRALTGNIVFPGFTAPKLAWLAAHEPDIFERCARILLPKDYLRLWLTGEAVSEMSDAAGTAWLDVGKRRWSLELLAKTGLSLDQMPALVEGTEVSGRLRAALANELGLPAGIPVAGGAGDNAASALGLGTIAPGAAFASLGTSGVLFVATDGFAPNADSAVHAFCHALPGRWHQMGVILAATDALNWLAGITGADAATLTGELGQAITAPGPELFLPYLGGERTPLNDADARGQLLALSHASDRAALTRAVLQGVSSAFRDCLDALAVAGSAPERVLAVGGGSASRNWLGLLANTLGLPVDVPANGDYGAAFGAARLGLIAAETADPATICTAPLVRETIEPDAALADAFAAHQARYRAAYQATKNA